MQSNPEFTDRALAGSFNDPILDAMLFLDKKVFPMVYKKNLDNMVNLNVIGFTRGGMECKTPACLLGWWYRMTSISKVNARVGNIENMKEEIMRRTTSFISEGGDESMGIFRARVYKYLTVLDDLQARHKYLKEAISERMSELTMAIAA